MERVGRVSINAGALILAKVVTSVLTFGLAIAINRSLGPEKAGIYSYAIVLYTIFMVIPDFGIGNISVRDVSQDHSRIRRYFANIVSLRFLLSLAAFAILMLANLIVYAAGSDAALAGEKFWVVFAISFCLLIEQPFSNSLAENFIALERLIVVAFIYMLMGIAKVAMSIYVIEAGWDHVLVYLVLIYIITLLYSIINFYWLYRRALGKLGDARAEAEDMAAAEAVTHGGPAPGETALEALTADYSYAALSRGADTGEGAAGEGGGIAIPQPPDEDEAEVFRLWGFTRDRRLWRYLLLGAWPLAVVGAGITVYAGVDIPILSWLKGDAEVGLYYAAGMFAKALVFLTLALNMAVLPAISKVGGKHPARLGEVWERIIRYVWILVIFFVVVVPVLARPFLIFQEHQYIEAWHATWLTMAAMNFTFMTAISFPFFIVINRQKVVTVIVAVSLALKVAMDFALIPLLGYTGAAIVVLASEFAVFVLLCFRLSRELRHHINPVRFAGVPLLMLGTLYGAAFLLNKTIAVGRDTAASAALAALVIAAALTVLYLALAFLTGILRRKGVQELNDLLTV